MNGTKRHVTPTSCADASQPAASSPLADESDPYRPLPDGWPAQPTVHDAMEWIAFRSVISEDEANRQQRAIQEQWGETSDADRIQYFREQEAGNFALEAARLKLVDAIERGLLIGKGQLDRFEKPNPDAPDVPITASLLTQNTTITADGTLGPDPNKPLAYLRWGTPVLVPDPDKPGGHRQHQNIRYRNIRFQAADILRLWPPRDQREAPSGQVPAGGDTAPAAAHSGGQSPQDGRNEAGGGEKPPLAENIKKAKYLFSALKCSGTPRPSDDEAKIILEQHFSKVRRDRAHTLVVEFWGPGKRGPRPPGSAKLVSKARR